MRYIVTWCVAMIVGTVLALAWTDKALKESGRQRDAAVAASEIWQARHAEAKIDAERKDTVWRKAKARVDTLRDSVLLRLTDTAYVIQYIKEADAALLACTDFANSCRRALAAADTALLAEQQVSAANWKMYQAAKPTWKDRFGVSCGYSAIKVGADVKAGPGCGLSLRIWP